MTHGGAWRGAIVCALALVFVRAAAASDYSDRCESTDGTYVVEDGALYEAEARARGAATAIPFTVLSRTVEAEEAGYCLSWEKDAGDRHFDFQYRRSIDRIGFEIGGASREAEMRCVLEADGLPAAYECDRKVVTRRSGVVSPLPDLAPAAGAAGTSDPQAGSGKVVEALDAALQGKSPPAPPAPSATDAGTWEHNGSTLTMIADGDDRRLLYTEPRAGLTANGVEPGTLLFGGRMEGTSLVGRARIFTKRCGELSYAVRGAFENGGARLVLTGKVPRVDEACRPGRWADDRLVFIRTK